MRVGGTWTKRIAEEVGRSMQTEVFQGWNKWPLPWIGGRGGREEQ